MFKRTLKNTLLWGFNTGLQSTTISIFFQITARTMLSLDFQGKRNTESDSQLGIKITYTLRVYAKSNYQFVHCIHLKIIMVHCCILSGYFSCCSEKRSKFYMQSS